MAREFKLPDIGEGVHEGEIVKWLVKEGAPIKENDLMVEVMTDKVTVQIPSPVTGKVLKLLAKEGQTVLVGTTIILLGEAGESAPATSSPAPAPQATPAIARAQATAAQAPASSSGGPALAAPAVRKLARELGVNLDAVRGSGSGGRITEDDVRNAHKAPTPAIAPRPALAVEELPPKRAPSGLEERIPIHGLRKRIAEKMAKSHATVAPFTYVEEVDMTQLVHLRDRLKEAAEGKAVKLTYLPFVVKALIAALKEHPTLNASVDDEKQEIVVKRYFNIGIATATDEGLTVTVVHDADKKEIWALAREIDRLAAAAREKKLTLHEIQGGTFTITSLGKEGGMFATPIINWPEVGIIGVHKIEKRPVVRNDLVVIREMMYLSCTFDHRVIDGHVGAAFVQAIVKYLEHPALQFVGLE
ncbi:MAG TPA: dihydrolipoamide acetyltransferase family protein [Thermoplasmata archaeon]|nr:dihydrolipoamide acetyltransferase family protein [Thermoplasmata archaeon]